MSDTAEEETVTTITATVEAAAINMVAEEIGAWAEQKGFREDYDDAEWLGNLPQLLNLPDSEITRRLGEVARRHYEMANTTKLMLMVSELAEALEGQRDGDDDNYGEELADVVIRAFENAQKNKVPIGDVIIRKMAVNAERPHRHGRKF